MLIRFYIAAAGFTAATVGAAEFRFEKQTFTVPDGFVVERVAVAPLTERPITADFDEQGRLYVAESSGTNDSVEQQLKDKPHSILRLEDTDGDGQFDKRAVFADGMMFPAGTLWHDGSLYVTAPPEIWKLTDTDDDGVADQREIWFNPGTLTGCANDLHGPYLGPDGWIYWCKGAFAEQNLTLTTGEPFRTRAAHIFRRHPDGGGVEPVMTGGMDNPVEVAFSPGGERFFSSTFIQHPGGGRRDGIIHAIYGGTYGKIHNVIDDHPRTGEILSPLVHLGPAAACALMRYESDAFGPDYRDNLFSSSFNLHKISRHQLIREGSTYRSIDSDFLVSDNPDFHPTHMREDADGSLLIIDTGGWYKLCCPTSQLHKPDVLGAIYRVSRVNVPVQQDPRGTRLNWENVGFADLAQRLGDSRPAVRRRAIQALGGAGEHSVIELRRVLEESDSPTARTAAIWALTRVGHPTAHQTIRTALNDSDETVRQAALHSVALWRDEEAVAALTIIVQQGTPFNRRAAAEALGRIGDDRAVPALLNAAERPVDRILEHSIIYALIEIGAPIPIEQAMHSAGPPGRRVGLIALDQLNHVQPEQVVPLLSSNEPVLRETANWIVNRHQNWGAALTRYFQERMQDPVMPAEERDRLAVQIAGFANDPAVKEMIAEGLRDEDASVRGNSLRIIAASKMNGVPRSWVDPLSEQLHVANSEASFNSILTALRALPLEKGDTRPISLALADVASRAGLPDSRRIELLGLIPSSPLTLDNSQFELLVRGLDPESSMITRSTAARTLARARLSKSQLTTLAGQLSTVGPIELRDLLGAFEDQSDEVLGRALIEALAARKSSNGLRREVIEPAIKGFPESVQEQATMLFATLNQDAADKQAHLDQLLNSLADGDIRRGQNLFNSERAACSSCHAIGYLGGTIGPDLTTIGTVRTDRDLLEAIVYPSVSFVRSYEPVEISTRDDLSYSGVLKEERENEVVLLTGLGAETRIARSDIVEMTPGNLSLMPDGLTDLLTKTELADLLAFLKATKWR